MLEINRDIIEIKMQGLGGQGVVMAVEIMGSILSKIGYQVQLFSQYGAERRGGQVASYLRLSREKILVHSQIYEADYLVVASSTLISDTSIAPNVKEGGMLFINCAKLPEGFSISKKDIRIVTLDADTIAIKNGVCLPSGMPVINTTMVGGFMAFFPDVHFDIIAAVLREEGIPAVEKNIVAAREAFEYIRQWSENRGAASIECMEETETTVKRRIPGFQVRPSPCETSCPAGVSIRRFVTLTQEAAFDEASSVFRVENPFPGITGRACFHPCETACNRSRFDESISISALERVAYDHAKEVIPKNRLKSNLGTEKVAIIGSGPAGMSCAYFLRMLGHEVSIFEALPVPGGIPRIGIPAYRLPRKVVDQYMEELAQMGIRLRTGIEVDKEAFETIMADHDACFVATGAHSPIRLNIPGEQGKDVISGPEFLKNVALGIDMQLGRKIVVIGGGNTAVDAARSAKRMGVPEVTILYRRSAKEMPAYPEEVKHAVEEGIEIVHLVMPVHIHRRKGNMERLECLKMVLTDEEQDGRRKVLPIEGTNFNIDVENIITAVGENVHVPFLPDGVKKKDSLVVVDCLGRTSMKGIYAGGDVTSFFRSIAHAIGSGKMAAIGIDLYLKRGDEEVGKIIEARGNNKLTMAEYLSGNFNATASPVVSYEELNLDYFEKSPRTTPRELAPETRISNFQEVNKGLSKKKASLEAQRCFHCGECISCGNCYIFCPDISVSIEDKGILPTVNLEFCKGCGICVTECPHGVIQWENR